MTIVFCLERPSLGLSDTWRLTSTLKLHEGHAYGPNTTFHKVFRMYQIFTIMLLDYLPKIVLRATSHTRLRARDQYTSSTLIGGKGGAGPSLLHTKLEGPTEYICECKMDVKSTHIPTWHQMDQVS
jgi:hypothetical protein